MSGFTADGSASKNDTRREDFASRLREFGRASAAGVDALPMAFIDLIDMAASGVVSLNKPAKGEKDDAAWAYDNYLNAQSKKLVHSDKGATANASKFRQGIAFGVMVTCDPIDVRDRAIKIHKEFRAKEIKVKALFPALVDVCRVQKGKDTDLTDDEISEAMLKPEPKEKTVESELQRALDIVEGVITGEAGVKDQEPGTLQAQAALQERLSALKTKNEMLTMVSKLRELGRDDQAAAIEASIA